MPLSVRHWSSLNGSGMHHIAESCAEAERALGHDSVVVDVDHETAAWDESITADIHVAHTHFPDVVRDRITREYRVVFVGHGTPEHVFEKTIEAFEKPGYGHGDGWQLLREWLKTADAVVTFWPRHAAFYQSLVPLSRKIDCVPLGVDRTFWSGGKDYGRYAGTPSVWMSENQHRIKWALDAIIAWGDDYAIAEEFPQARLHAHYIVWPLHRFFVDLANSNGASYRGYFSPATYPHGALRDIWRSFDFFLSPVRYGDHNALSMQAGAAGLTVISYRGNEYADYWITEGDQREMARELVAIFRGDTPPKDKLEVPDLSEMGRAMIRIYERILSSDPQHRARRPYQPAVLAPRPAPVVLDFRTPEVRERMEREATDRSAADSLLAESVPHTLGVET